MKNALFLSRRDHVIITTDLKHDTGQVLRNHDTAHRLDQSYYFCKCADKPGAEASRSPGTQALGIQYRQYRELVPMFISGWGYCFEYEACQRMPNPDDEPLTLRFNELIRARIVKRRPVFNASNRLQLYA